jgi:hypothetical protein
MKVCRPSGPSLMLPLNVIMKIWWLSSAYRVRCTTAGGGLSDIDNHPCADPERTRLAELFSTRSSLLLLLEGEVLSTLQLRPTDLHNPQTHGNEPLPCVPFLSPILPPLTNPLPDCTDCRKWAGAMSVSLSFPPLHLLSSPPLHLKLLILNTQF